MINDHVPSLLVLPKVLRSLPWEAVDLGREWCDGDTFLAAVPCGRTGDWGYALAVVTVSCDEGCFDLTLDGDPWGWDISDVDFVLPLRDKVR